MCVLSHAHVFEILYHHYGVTVKHRIWVTAQKSVLIYRRFIKDYMGSNTQCVVLVCYLERKRTKYIIITQTIVLINYNVFQTSKRISPTEL